MLAGEAKHCLVYGGSRSGKTFLFCYAICVRAFGAPGSRHAIFRRHSVAVRQSVGQDTMRKVLSLAWPDVSVQWNDRDGYFGLPNGSEIWLAGLDDKERVDKVLGKEFSTLYHNEASEIPYQSYVVAGTRLAQNVETIRGETLRLKEYVDLNPTGRNHWTYRLWRDGVRPDDEAPINRTDYVWAQVNPEDNRDNLQGSYLASLRELPDRARKRFYEGDYSGDSDTALWLREYFRRAQPTADGRWPTDMQRVVVAIDPAASTEPGSDETGIVCVARGADGQGYVLGDASGRFRPEEWASRALALYTEHSADRIIAEVNNGGDMVEAVIKAQNPLVPVKQVRASRGKVARAEPIAALYELGRVYHAPGLEKLEDQCCQMTIDFDPRAQGWSPDRVDALVWGMTELFPGLTRKPEFNKPIVVNSGYAAKRRRH